MKKGKNPGTEVQAGGRLRSASGQTCPRRATVRIAPWLTRGEAARSVATFDSSATS